MLVLQICICLYILSFQNIKISLHCNAYYHNYSKFTLKKLFYFYRFNYSDDRSDLTEQLYIDPNLYVDIGNGDYCCPASPTTVPGRIVSSNSLESPARTTPSRPARRQRTTSVNSQSTTANPAECIIRANNRTIYTAGRPPWYNCAGQQVEPFVIGEFRR